MRADLEAHAPRALAVARPLRVVISNLPPGHVETVQAKVPPRQPTLPLPEVSQERRSAMLMDFGLHHPWQCSALVLYTNVWSPAHRTSCMTAAWRFVNASCRPWFCHVVLSCKKQRCLRSLSMQTVPAAEGEHRVVWGALLGVAHIDCPSCD